MTASLSPLAILHAAQDKAGFQVASALQAHTVDSQGFPISNWNSRVLLHRAAVKKFFSQSLNISAIALTQSYILLFSAPYTLLFFIICLQKV